MFIADASIPSVYVSYRVRVVFLNGRVAWRRFETSHASLTYAEFVSMDPQLSSLQIYGVDDAGARIILRR